MGTAAFYPPLSCDVYIIRLTDNQVDTSGQWECPDFYPLPGSDSGLYVLKGSTDGKEYWSTGLYDEQTCTFSPKGGMVPTFNQMYDYGAFYAR